MRLLTAFLLLIVLAACTPSPAAPATIPSDTPTRPPLATPSATRTLHPTVTPSPLPTASPTPAPTPPGGGGTLVLTLLQDITVSSYPEVPGKINVFAASLTGPDLVPLTYGPAGSVNIALGLSDDGQTLLYLSGPEVSPIIDLRHDYRQFDLWTVAMNSGSPQMVSGGVKTFLHAAVWRPDLTILFLGWDADGLGVWQVSDTGSGLARIAPPVGAPGGIAKILFTAPDGSGIYWVTGGWCPSNGLCSPRYYFTGFDGSQQQIWQNIIAAGSDISISPDGQWIAYRRFSSDPQLKPENGCWAAHIDGSNPRRVGQECIRSSTPSVMLWSPDSTRLLYWDRDDDRQAFPLQVYSLADGTSLELPEFGAPSCELPFWLTEERLVLFDCRANFIGYSIPAAPRILNPLSGEVTLLPDTGFCDVRLSPDRQQFFLADCSQDEEAQAIAFGRLDLVSVQLEPLFPELQITGEDGWVQFFLDDSDWAAPTP